uniref:Uncharacterized protein n=1 Tax=Tanacetum cinerariifolium TaxID=118510 RepID=A0A6L2L6V8_TANCI|nr:hypothetical protein [Tanacetum cinerariifolium]
MAALRLGNPSASIMRNSNSLHSMYATSFDIFASYANEAACILCLNLPPKRLLVSVASWPSASDVGVVARAWRRRVRGHVRFDEDPHYHIQRSN